MIHLIEILILTIFTTLSDQPHQEAFRSYHTPSEAPSEYADTLFPITSTF